MNLLQELKTVSSYEYKRIETRTIADIEEVERLVAVGWRIYQSSIFSVTLERKTKPTGRK